MISLALAQKLKKAGLNWSPIKNDFFVVPDRGLDEQIFVITDLAVIVEKLHGQLSITFHGTPEWALDQVVITEAVWLPTESQLREMLELRLVVERQPAIRLSSVSDGYWCEIQFQERVVIFEAFGAAEAYGTALLYVLETEK